LDFGLTRFAFRLWQVLREGRQTEGRAMRAKGFMKAGLVAAVLATSLPGPFTQAAAETKTSKERLSDKASDDQRVDNCGVAAERRGAVSRPNCSEQAESARTAKGQGTARAEERADGH
jgi:hypothetical protein